MSGQSFLLTTQISIKIKVRYVKIVKVPQLSMLIFILIYTANIKFLSTDFALENKVYFSKYVKEKKINTMLENKNNWFIFVTWLEEVPRVHEENYLLLALRQQGPSVYKHWVFVELNYHP